VSHTVQPGAACHGCTRKLGELHRPTCSLSGTVTATNILTGFGEIDAPLYEDFSPGAGFARPEWVDGHIDRAEEAADRKAPAWKDDLAAAARACAERLPRFTADDVWDEMVEQHGEEYAKSGTPSVIGPVMLGLERDGIAKPTGEWVWTRHRRRHRQIQVWESA
jgi:hypothetical protein